jgi:hypothetical protein
VTFRLEKLLAQSKRGFMVVVPADLAPTRSLNRSDATRCGHRSTVTVPIGFLQGRAYSAKFAENWNAYNNLERPSA